LVEVARRLTERLVPYPAEHALLAFVGRTLGRSRQHRSVLAIYAELGLAYIFSDIVGVIYSPHSFTA
jgi:hypothetical protein